MKRRLTVALSCRRPGGLGGVEASWLAKDALCRSRQPVVSRSVSVYSAVFDVQLADGVVNAACSAGLVSAFNRDQG